MRQGTLHLFTPSSRTNTFRFEPPAESRPEAANFPNQQYQFSDSHSLFKAPQAYPEPPKDMWYKVPESRPKPAQAPAPIFPWERQPDRPKATRVFAEDFPPEPTPAPAIPSPTHTFSTIHYQDESAGSSGGARNVTGSQAAFQQANVNAWDNDPGIESYVRAIMELHQGGKPQTARQASGLTQSDASLRERRNRRESLIITDFPSAVERPSLPVTPAPVRRPSFWGEERDESGELPAAEGLCQTNQNGYVRNAVFPLSTHLILVVMPRVRHQ